MTGAHRVLRLPAILDHAVSVDFAQRFIELDITAEGDTAEAADRLARVALVLATV